jgi:hypothetical protein
MRAFWLPGCRRRPYHRSRLSPNLEFYAYHGVGRQSMSNARSQLAGARRHSKKVLSPLTTRRERPDVDSDDLIFGAAGSPRATIPTWPRQSGANFFRADGAVSDDGRVAAGVQGELFSSDFARIRAERITNAARHFFALCVRFLRRTSQQGGNHPCSVKS